MSIPVNAPPQEGRGDLEEKLAAAQTLAASRWNIIDRLTKQHNEWKALAEQREAELSRLTEARDRLQSRVDDLEGIIRRHNRG